MVNVSEFLRGFQFNNQSFGGGGPVDPSLGGFTTSNAPFAFAQLLQSLSEPGGPLSSLGLNQILAGQQGSIVEANQAARDATLSQLADAGANPATAAIATAGLDQQLLQQFGQARSQALQALQSQQTQAQTQFVNVLAQSEETQKVRTEQVRQFEALRDDIKDQNKFNRILGIAGLALPFIGPLFSGLFGAEGAEGAVTAGAGGAAPSFAGGPAGVAGAIAGPDLTQLGPLGGGISPLQAGGPGQFGGAGGFDAAAGGGFDLNKAFGSLVGLLQQPAATGAGAPGGGGAPQFQTGAAGPQGLTPAFGPQSLEELVQLFGGGGQVQVQ